MTAIVCLVIYDVLNMSMNVPRSISLLIAALMIVISWLISSEVKYPF